MAEFEQFLWFGMALAIAIMAVLGWAAVHRGLLPLRTLSQKAAATSVTRHDEPLAVAGVPPELRQLVLAFNRMRPRIDDSFRRLSERRLSERRLSEFSSDLAHELRAPIHNMLIQSQVTLSQEPDPEVYRAALQANIEDLERLSALASDMLFIARADNRLLAPTRQPIELDQEVEQLLAFYEAYAAGRGVTLHQAGTATVSGGRAMLQCAVQPAVERDPIRAAGRRGGRHDLARCRCHRSRREEPRSGNPCRTSVAHLRAPIPGRSFAPGG